MAKSSADQSIEDVFNPSAGLKHSLTSAVELETLGRGQFGRVYKVRDAFDNKIYAVKRIQINLDGKNAHENFQDIKNEVEVLSDLNHPNIVRYYKAWIEKTSDSEESGSEDECENESSESEASSTPELESADLSAEEDKYHKDGSEVNIWKHSLTDEETHVPDNESRGGKNRLYDICIQMEFCSSSLKEVIQSGLNTDVETFWRLLKQILLGLKCIHDRGIIHRDIKPSNIFLTDTMCIKIGDFGLATTKSRKMMSDSNAVSEHAAHKCDDVNSVQIARDEYSSLTGNVGTKLYAAPETKASERCRYDDKSDMYSLGLTVFEMSYRSLQTEMERSKVFEKLARTILPPDFDETSKPMQVKIIKSLVQENPSQRPTAKDILDPANEYLPPSLEEEQQFQTKLREILRDRKSQRRLMLFHDIFSSHDISHSDHVSDKETEQQSGEIIDNNIVRLRDSFTGLCRQHGAREFNLPILVPRSPDFESSGEMLLADKTGNIQSLIHDPNIIIARYLAHQEVEEVKLYSICPVYRRDEGKKLQEHRIYTFYHMTSVNKPETLSDSLLMLHQFVSDKLSLKDYQLLFVLGNSDLTESYFADIGIKDSKYKELIKSAIEKNRRLNEDMLVIQGLEKEKAQEVCQNTRPRLIGSLLEDLGEKFSSLAKLSPKTKALFQTVLNKYMLINSHDDLVSANTKVLFAFDLLRFMKFTSGCVFALHIRSKSRSERIRVAHGGECDNLLYSSKFLTSSTRRNHYLFSFNVLIDKLLVRMSELESNKEKAM